jgi:tetratricopeptide (TPR) repeat protein
MATSYHHLGNTLLKNKDFDQAISQYQAALTIEEEESDKQGMANTLLQIGEVANEQHRYEDAVFYFSCARHFYLQSEAALAVILSKRIERMFDLLSEGTVRAIERDVQRRMGAGEKFSELIAGSQQKQDESEDSPVV